MTKFLSDDWMLIHGFMKPDSFPIFDKNIKINESHISGSLTMPRNSNETFEGIKKRTRMEIVDSTPIMKNNQIIGIFSLEKFMEKVMKIGIKDATSTRMENLVSKEYILINNVNDYLMRILKCPVPVLIEQGDGKFIIVDKQKTMENIISANS